MAPGYSRRGGFRPTRGNGDRRSDAAPHALHLHRHERVRQLKAFYLHAGIYAVVMLGLLAIDAATRGTGHDMMFNGRTFHDSGGDWWVLWPALGWGIAVAIHAMVVLMGGIGRMDEWEDRKVEEIVRREKERSGV
jgi:hypothetical protein